MLKSEADRYLPDEDKTLDSAELKVRFLTFLRGLPGDWNLLDRLFEKNARVLRRKLRPGQASTLRLSGDGGSPKVLDVIEDVLVVPADDIHKFVESEATKL